jgi:hypothetical protein
MSRRLGGQTGVGWKDIHVIWRPHVACVIIERHNEREAESFSVCTHLDVS